MIVVDASGMLELLLQSEHSNIIHVRVLSRDELLVAPQLTDIEVSRVLHRYWLAKEIPAKRGGEAIADLADFPLQRFPHTVLLPRIWQLRNNLSSYDAAYVALAEAIDAPLFTCDAKLAGSKGHRAKIETL